MSAVTRLEHPPVTWRLHADPAVAAEALAADVATRLRGALAVRGVASLAVPGGSTPATFLRALSRYALDWPRVTVLPTDERWVPERHPASNAAFIGRALREGPAASCTWRPLYVPGRSADEALATVEARLASLPWPLDVVVVGMGSDGHVASLFPDADGERVHPARPARACAASAPDGTPRLSLTLSALAGARSLYLLIHGREKRALLVDALARESGAPLPVRRLLDAHEGRALIHHADVREA